MNSISMNRICARMLATKLQAVHSLKYPEIARQIEQHPELTKLLWFIQAMSLKPGGLDAFAADLIKHCGDQFGTASMRSAGPPSEDGNYSLEQCLGIWTSERDREATGQRLGERAIDKMAPSSHLESSSQSFEDWLEGKSFLFSESTQRESGVREGLRRFNRDFLLGRCLMAARRDLARFMWRLCHIEDVGFDCWPWYCQGFPGILSDYMDRHARDTLAALADTEITRTAFHWLEFALESRTPVPIVGASRFGKTKAISAWCESRPGVARMVVVPPSNRSRDFFCAIADALGISYTDRTPVGYLKDWCEHVHQQSGLFLVFDEAHFLVPSNYSKNTAPMRLNWVRCHVVDRNLGCAFFATPQSYRQTFEDYVRITGYNFDQWMGRLAPHVVLPEEINVEDLLAIARCHFPDFSPAVLKYIAGVARFSEGYVSAIQHVGRYARFLAKSAGRNSVAIADVKRSVGVMRPGGVPPGPAQAIPDRTNSSNDGAFDPACTPAERDMHSGCRRQISSLPRISEARGASLTEFTELAEA